MHPRLDQRRHQRDAAHVHNLGPRPVYEAFAEVARRVPDPGVVWSVLAEFRVVDGAVIRTLQADRFPPQPLQAVA